MAEIPHAQSRQRVPAVDKYALARVLYASVTSDKHFKELLLLREAPLSPPPQHRLSTSLAPLWDRQPVIR
eukprot:scaffold148651_cov31-Tisochrysis_lutea.AAC.9